MSMLRRAQHRRRDLLRRTTAAACMLFFAMTGHEALAGSNDALHDVYGYYSYMMDVKDEIASYRAAKEALAQAKKDLADAQQNLADAKAGVADAAANLAQAKANLHDAEDHLAAVKIALAAAEEASAQRTREAIAAQQAEADYAPTVYAQRAHVAAVNAQYDRTVETVSGRTSPRSPAGQDRAAVVARVLKEVGYQQNRVVDAQVMVDAALAGATPEAAATGEAETEAIDRASAAVEAAQSELDAVEDYFSQLTAAREAAEDAERDAREAVAGYQQDLADSTTNLAEATSYVTDAENYQQQAAAWERDAVRDEGTAEQQLRVAQHDLDYFGEGAGWQTGAEYYAWRGERGGHQLYLPLSYYKRTHRGKQKLDYGLSTGYVKSDTGFVNGAVSGWTDTSLSLTLRNENPVNSVRYGFGISIPTGQSRIGAKAVVPESLARFTDFGAGWQYIPSIEVLHKITEQDRLTGRMSYTMRGGYNYSREVWDAHVSPGNIFAQELEYLHTDAKKTYMVQLYHNATGNAVQDSIDTDAGTITGKSHYRDGDDWELRFFYHRGITKKDALRYYTILSQTQAGTAPGSSSIGRQYYGIGVRHTISKRLTWQVMAHYQKVNSTYDPLRTELNTGGGFSRRSLLAELACRMSDRKQLVLQTERYVRTDEGGGGYHGWGMTLWYNESL